MAKKVIVTGSGGFVMGNLVRRAIFTKQNWEILSLDKLKAHHYIHNIYINKDHEFYPSDVTDEHFINLFVGYHSPDVIIHGVDCSENHIKNIATSTNNILEAAIKNNVKHFVLVSSYDVPGNTEKSHLESAPANNKTPEATARACAELIAKSYEDKINVSILRVSDVFGPWQSQKSLLPKVVKSLLDSTELKVDEHGMSTREWTHVHDVCAAIFEVVSKNITGTLNISSNFEFSNVEFSHLITNLLGKGQGAITFCKDKDAFRYSVDTSQLRDIPWNPEHKIKESLTSTLRWYIDNQFFLKM